MSRGVSKRKKVRQEQIKIDPPDNKILDSIGDPNVWTPETEDAWLEELNKISSVEIYKRYPPMKKPPNVRSRGKSFYA